MKLIAEIGQVHEGSLGLALKYVEELAKRNIKTVKFQMHLADYESSDYEMWRVPFSKQDAKRSDYWRRTGFTFEQWQILFDYCLELDVEFLCTPFSLKAVDYLEKLGVKRYKVGSADWNNLPLLEYISMTGKPTIISTGLADLDVLQNILSEVFHSMYDLELMYCVTAYPAPPETIDFSNIGKLKKKFNCNIGYSDHSGEHLTGVAAFLNKAHSYEFHITNSYANFGPDVKASLDFDGLSKLQKSIEYISKLGLTPQSNQDKKYVSKVFSRSLGVRDTINKGEIITMKNIEVKKPGGIGIHVEFFSSVIGRTVNKDLKVGDFITAGDLDD